MKPVKTLVPTAILTLCVMCVLSVACTGVGEEIHLMAGTLDGPLPVDSAPARVMQAFERAGRFHQHDILDDTAALVAVFSIDEAETTSTEGYGVVVVKGNTSTTFPHIRNVRQPLARYDQQTGNLWLAASAMEGSGVAVERLYQIRFDADDKAFVAHIVEPYDVQRQLCQRLGYSIDGQWVTLYDGRREVARAANTITDMGGFDDEQPLWIGEQMVYDLGGTSPRLLLTPGVKFTVGLALTYDDMPTLSAPITLTGEGRVNIGRLAPVVRPYEGVYLDEDNSDPNLHIRYRRSDGRYDVEVGIFRLTFLDDGIGEVGDQGLTFKATDAAGQPIGGVVTLHQDTATVTFTDTTWPLIEPGAQFRYVRQAGNAYDL